MIQVSGFTHGGPGRVDLVERVPEPGPSYADVSEMLLMEFGPTHGLRRVSELLQSCRVRLADDPSGTPKALERLARAELSVPMVLVPRQAAR